MKWPGYWPNEYSARLWSARLESYQKLKKMERDATLLSTQHYKVSIKGKVEQSWEWSSALPYTLKL